MTILLPLFEQLILIMPDTGVHTVLLGTDISGGKVKYRRSVFFIGILFVVIDKV
jgi:hypothetical protein